jgi:hypothetical protein
LIDVLHNVQGIAAGVVAKNYDETTRMSLPIVTFTSAMKRIESTKQWSSIISKTLLQAGQKTYSLLSEWEEAKAKQQQQEPYNRVGGDFSSTDDDDSDDEDEQLDGNTSGAAAGNVGFEMARAGNQMLPPPYRENAPAPPAVPPGASEEGPPVALPPTATFPTVIPGTLPSPQHQGPQQPARDPFHVVQPNMKATIQGANQQHAVRGKRKGLSRSYNRGSFKMPAFVQPPSKATRLA